MTRGTRLLLFVVLGSVLLALTTIGAGAAAVYRAGTVAVEVVEDGDRFDVRLPAALVRAAIALVPGSVVEDAARELEPVLPALDAGWRELRDLPDCVLVEVLSGDETIVVEKSGSDLLIAVDSPDGRVRVAVPVGTVGSLVRKLSG